MKYYVAILRIKDMKKNNETRDQHVDFVERMVSEKKAFLFGTFTDDTGGMIVYTAENYEEAERIASADPYIFKNARDLELHEWIMKTKAVIEW